MQAIKMKNTVYTELTEAISNHTRQLDRRYDYQIKNLLNEEFMHEVGDAGGQLTGYLINGQLQKAEAIFYRKDGQTKRTFYYMENMLVQVKEIELSYNYHINEAEFQKDTSIEAFSGVFFFQYGKLIDEKRKVFLIITQQ